MTKEHDYTSRVVWTGNKGTGTSSYKSYDRTWNIEAPGKPVMNCSNDPLLGGDPTLMNPEDLMLSALSACHMLWYLHLASNAGITVMSYEDCPVGTGETAKTGAGRFLSATLHPKIRVKAGDDLKLADEIHGKIHQYCFIARSVNFPVSYDAKITEA